MIDTLSLDQLRVLIAVAETGSFSAAARRLQRAQSAVSYAIAQLEQSLGVRLFDRSDWRPRLTEAGTALASDARAVLDRTERIKERARALSEGLETELPIAIEAMSSMRRAIELIAAFQRKFPAVTLNVHIACLGDVAELVLSGVCRLGILCPWPGVPAGLFCQPLNAIPVEVVAAPNHPLAVEQGPIAWSTLDEHVQIELTDRRMYTRLFISRKHLRTADIGWKHAMLRAGLGWGWMPRELVEEDIACGRLRVLALENRPPESIEVPGVVIRRQDDALGPSGRWIFEWLTSGTQLAVAGPVAVGPVPASSAVPVHSARQQSPEQPTAKRRRSNNSK
jgi:DNA-binding transcriptional LysR family regulator